MANLIDIRRRIRSVKNTQQITKAMKMISAARLRRAQDRALAARPYAQRLQEVITNLVARGGRLRHPLLETRPENRVLLIVVTGDKGLAGSFNVNVLRRAGELAGRLPGVEMLLLGRKGADFYKRRSYPIRNSYTTLFTNVTAEAAQEIADDVQKAYVEKQCDAVYVVYNKFKSMLAQELTEVRLLPIPTPPVDEAADDGREYIFEPSAESILEELLPHHIGIQIYRILLESQAAEHAARMSAMDAATRNAGEMIDRLTLQYNRARQAIITTQLIEVVSGANALEG